MTRMVPPSSTEVVTDEGIRGSVIFFLRSVSLAVGDLEIRKLAKVLRNPSRMPMPPVLACFFKVPFGGESSIVETTKNNFIK